MSTTAVFAYGTLEIPAVMEAVTGRRFPRAAGTLRGFARFRVEGEVYPGLVRAPRARTAGVVYTSVDARSLERLDDFEGDLYERRPVQVRLSAGGHASAYAYVVRASGRARISTEPWDRARFVADELQEYLTECRAFRARRLARTGR
ncbi:MAG: gamma-glutamylcyclotransferase [Deltaproteobacteria bacterium]|nr:MAG: gamma-glutamylcyclotransferase [Deltaproteobacteria bacterium]